MENYKIIEDKLKQFIRKYYIDQIIKGSIFVIVFFMILALVLIFAESIIYFNKNQKFIIVIAFVVMLFTGIGFYIVLPFLSLLGIRKGISHKRMNEIIVHHFSEIKDTLWNVIELHDNQNTLKSYSNELVLASIEQKIGKLKHFNFQEAINFRKNIRFLYAFIGVSTIAILSIIGFNDTLKSSSERLIHFNVSYEKPSPYQFNLINDVLQIGKGDDFVVWVDVKSQLDINECNIIFGGNSYLMTRDSSNVFRYKFSNINNSVKFKFEIGQFKSREYEIEILEKPLITSFVVEVNKPAYTNQVSQTFENLAEIVIPTGSSCNFSFNTFATDSVIIRDSKNQLISAKAAKKGKFEWNQRFVDNELLSVSIKNKHFEEIDLFNIYIEVINDEYPTISIQQIVDSTKMATFYYRGLISDDYGFNKLTFNTRVDNVVDSVFTINIQKNMLQQSFFYAYDFNHYKGRAKEVNFYFEVFDNDQVNGSKSSISETFSFVFPDAKDIFEKQDSEYDDIEQLLKDSRIFTDQIQKDLFELQQKMINSNLNEWEKKEAVKNIMNNKQKLENTLNKLQQKSDEINKYMESFTEPNQELLQKQQQIQDLLEQVFSEELKKLMEEFNKMLEEFNQNRFNKLKEEMDFSLKDLEKQLDRNLEMLRKMQVEQKLDLITNELKEAIKKQEESIENLEKGSDKDAVSDEQLALKEKLDDLKKEYENAKDLNQKLDKPINMLDFEKEFNGIDKEFSKSLDNLDKNNKKQGNESMKKNLQQMKDLDFMLQQMKDAAFAEEAAESLENMLQILHNLITLSFNQEEIIKTPANDFLIGVTLENQKRVKDHFSIIQDSLYTLSKRQAAITTIVNKEIVMVNNHLKITEDELREGRIHQAKVSQQIIMTSVNNLALFMSEVIKQMQEQMANSTPGDQNCSKPGGKNSKPGGEMSSMKQMQQSMQQQLQKLMQMMKEGAGERAMNNELGKALSQQEMMQNMMRQLMNEGTVGSKAYETLKAADQLMDRVRQDILRKNINQETLNRQQQILTRLLEAENAENEREQEERRKATTAKEQFFSNPAKYFDNPNSNDNFEERIIRNKLMLNPYYQSKYQQYINQLEIIDGAKN